MHLDGPSEYVRGANRPLLHLRSCFISRNVFLAYINHGVSPKNGSYAYYILPAQQSITAAKNDMDKISYVRQDKVHAVYNENLKMIQAAFFDKGSFTLSGTSLGITLPGGAARTVSVSFKTAEEERGMTETIVL